MNRTQFRGALVLKERKLSTETSPITSFTLAKSALNETDLTGKCENVF